MGRTPSRYTDPYLAGVGIGLVLLAAYVVTGRGLGASGAFSTVVAASTAAVVGADVAATSTALAPYLTLGAARGATPAVAVNPFADWLVVELIGVILGGFCSAWLAGRLAANVEGGQHLGLRPRILAAVGGGVLMGFGAKLARGCTSGQALSGGALLSTGSWIFIATCFAAGYALAPAARRLWR